MSITTAAADIDAKGWLKANGYKGVLALIVRLERKWKAAGKKTRRDWFLVLAGTPSGKPRTIDDTTFPMIQAFRRRQGYPLAATALALTPWEVAPPIRKQEGRWGKRFRRATH